MELPIPYRAVTVPAQLVTRKPHGKAEFIASDYIVKFLESRTSLPEFDYLGYEVKTVDEIDEIYCARAVSCQFCNLWLHLHLVQNHRL